MCNKRFKLVLFHTSCFVSICLQTYCEPKAFFLSTLQRFESNDTETNEQHLKSILTGLSELYVRTRCVACAFK